MTRRKWQFLATAVCSLCLLVAATFYFAADSSPTSHQTMTAPTPAASAAPAKNQPDAPASQPGAPQTAGTDPEEEANPYEDEALKAHLMQVADLYAQNMAFPPFSRPIPKGADLNEFRADRSPSSTALPFELMNDETVRLSIDLDKYVYFSDELIPVAVTVISDKGVEASAMTVRLADRQGNVLMSKEVTDYRGQWLTALDTRRVRNDEWPEELQVQAVVTVSGEQLFVSTPIRYQSAVARLTGVQPSRVSGEYLVIPLDFSVQRPGYYFIGVNLYSQSTGEPLVHLEAEGPLGSPSAQLSLKAHIAALKVAGDEGPYLLNDVSITRAAEIGEAFDLYGMPDRSSFAVEGFEFGAFKDVPYEDPLQQERLEFLRSLGRL
ncbi:hypothetical protein LPB19_08320 [Marinobacter salinisoli]|uniref:Uncharacterized protein n=1 Tax=Marinobacter salinisoli TaxID=2769486 RepID=A0ABX7MY60_9GAMM|nr:hypothetical protein [Marinobacter salinisoli]QSP96365.1 hypothetical protein LPB19_08320 [Marinobacter salinisoli]